MQKNTDSAAQTKRKKDAVASAVISSLFMLASAVVLLILRAIYLKGSFWGAVVLIMALGEIGAVVPVWILLKIRLKEIEGGEEDVAAQY